MEKVIEQDYTAQTLYDTMHATHLGYRHKNQGIARFCDWLHLLRDRRGEVHNPWSDTSTAVVELGCGNGKLCEILVSLGLDVTGVDIFDNDAVYNRNGYKFIKQDLMKSPYPFENNQFDYCLSFDVMEHLPEEYVAPALREMARISRSIIIGVSCTGEKPLHLTIKTPGWWLDRLIVNCQDYSWRLLRNHERVAIEKDNKGKSLPTSSDIRPFTNGEIITYAPLFYGKRGIIADED